jgi:cobalt-zinc-cadmium efflux system outer membrane protein
MAVGQRIAEARGLLRQAGVRPAPTIEVTGASGRPVGTIGEQQFSASISREVETAQKRTKRLHVAEAQLAIALAEYDERVRQLRYEIAALLAQYAADEERLRVIDSLTNINRRSLELTRARVEKGDAALLDQNLIMVEISRAEAQRSAVAGRVAATRADISRLIGLPAGETWTFPVVTFPSTVAFDGLADKALDQRPDLRLLRLTRQAGDAEIAVAEAEARPNWTLAAGYTRVSSRFDDQFGFTTSGQLTQLRDRDDIVQVAISVPVFSRNRNLGNIEASIGRRKAAELRAQYLERAIPLEVEAARRRFESSRTALASLNDGAIALGQNNLEVIRQAYQLGQMRLLDVLAEQRRVLDLQLASIDVQAELRRSLAELEKAVGGPIQ